MLQCIQAMVRIPIHLIFVSKRDRTPINKSLWLWPFHVIQSSKGIIVALALLYMVSLHCKEVQVHATYECSFLITEWITYIFTFKQEHIPWKHSQRYNEIWCAFKLKQYIWWRYIRNHSHATYFWKNQGCRRARFRQMPCVQPEFATAGQ